MVDDPCRGLIDDKASNGRHRAQQAIPSARCVEVQLYPPGWSGMSRLWVDSAGHVSLWLYGRASSLQISQCAGPSRLVQKRGGCISAALHASLNGPSPSYRPYLHPSFHRAATIDGKKATKPYGVHQCTYKHWRTGLRMMHRTWRRGQ